MSGIPRFLYKILPHHSEDVQFRLPSPLEPTYSLPLPQLDYDDGFMHTSAGPQVATTLELFFRHTKAITLVRMPVAGIEKRGQLEWLGPDGLSPPPPYRCAHARVSPLELYGAEVDGILEIIRKGSWAETLHRDYIEQFLL